MKKLKLFVFTLIFFSSYSLSVNSQSLDTKTKIYIDSLINASYPQHGPGLSLIIAENGIPLYKKAYGMADLESSIKLNSKNVLAIGSMTMQFTAAAILQLVNEGKINLNNDIKKYLPDYNTHGKIITIENCLTHTSGIPSFTEKHNFDSMYQKSFTKDEMIKYFEDDELLFDPGSDFSYSNSGYFLMGIIIEKVSGLSYENYIQKNIFDKLQMKKSYFGNNENNVPGRAIGYEAKDTVNFKVATFFDWSWPYSAGNIFSSTGDLLLWDEALYSEKVVPQLLLKKAWTPYILQNGLPTNYGYGWNSTWLNNFNIISHGGAINGYLSSGIRVPEKHLYFAVLSNNTSKTPDAITNKIALKLLNINDLPMQAIETDKSLLAEYTGAYEVNRDGGRILKNFTSNKQYRYVYSQGDSLVLQRTGGGTYSFLPYAKDKFFIEGSGRRFDFIRDEVGKIIALDVYEYPVNFGPHDICKKVDVPMPAAKLKISVPVDILKKYEGEFEVQPGFNLKMFIEDGNLFTQATGQNKIQLFPESNTKFFMKDVDAQVEFIEDTDGRVNKVNLTQGQKFECKRIK